jgi:D-alanyl-D-alanine carboxypeptidase
MMQLLGAPVLSGRFSQQWQDPTHPKIASKIVVTTAISNHSWGTAIDLTLEGILDTYGDGRVQVGLTLIAPIFNRRGWYWGAAFRKEDGMHFEASKALIEPWATPQPWPEAVSNRWSGACKAGRAQGLGVLRALRARQVVQAFYGRYDAGQPALGGVEVGGGFRAGRFGVDGQVVADGDRNTAIQAFDEGAAAARAMAAGLRRAGNIPSARFYEAKAKQLAEQLD